MDEEAEWSAVAQVVFLKVLKDEPEPIFFIFTIRSVDNRDDKRSMHIQSLISIKIKNTSADVPK